MDFHWFDIEADPAGWDREVTATGQSLFNLSALLAVHAFGGGRRRGVLLREGGATVGVLGGLSRPTPAGDAFESLCFPVLPQVNRQALVTELIAWLRREGYPRLRFGSFCGGVEDYRPEDPALQLHERLEFPWDLSVDEAGRRRALRSNHKRKLNKLGRQGLQLRRIDRHQSWVLTRARAQWAERKGEALPLRQLFRMYRYHRLLHKRLGQAGIGNLYGLYDERDTLLSVAYMLEHSGLSFYMIGASSPEGYRINASMQLFWDIARHYSEKGFRYLHLGGVPQAAVAEDHEEHGVYRFKHGFGIQPAERLTLSTHS